MANYVSQHTGSTIDTAVGKLVDNTFSEVMYGVTPSANPSNTAIITAGWYNNQITTSMNYQHPVGYIFEWSNSGLSNAPDLTTASKVAQYFGYGTWELFGQGRVLVGQGSTTDSASKSKSFSVGETDGYFDAVCVSHNHAQTNHSHDMAGEIWSSGADGKYNCYKKTSNRKKTTVNTAGAKANIESAGVSGADRNIQPYEVVYRWRRIA